LSRAPYAAVLWSAALIGAGGTTGGARGADDPAETGYSDVRSRATTPSISLVRHAYLQQVTPTSITLVWRTDTATDSRVEYVAEGDLTVLDATVNLVTVDHAVTIDGLSPSTRYHYSVGSTMQTYDGGTEEHFFETAPRPGDRTPFRVWVCADGGTGGLMQRSVMNAALSVAGDDPPDIGLYIGDLAYADGTDWEFTVRFFEPYRQLLQNTVIWPALGNHDIHSVDPRTGEGPYFAAFMLPQQGEAGGLPSGTESYYSFEYGSAHFMALDSAAGDLSPGSPMLTWLTADLVQAMSARHRWRIAFLHHPPYSKGTHDSDNASDSGGRMRDVRENVVPLLEAGGVDLVLSGHSHTYERSYLLRGAFGYGAAPHYATPDFATLLSNGHVLDSGNGRALGDGAYLKPLQNRPSEGTVYIVAGHGGNTTGVSGLHPVMFFAEDIHGSLLLDVDETELTVRNVRHDGVVSDTFTILKVCSVDEDCDDGDPCTDDACVAGSCEHSANAVPCDDGDPCTAGDTCADGSCAGAPAPDCPPGAPCTEDCNGNSVPDGCDLHGGTSTDCDANQVPDDCQADSDGDGSTDPCDPCPNDFLDDSDGDGVCDSMDGCPGDSAKIHPGECGCGVAETGDSDGDGVPDCHDVCPGVSDGLFAHASGEAIPAASTWGLIVLALGLATASKIVFRRR